NNMANLRRKRKECPYCGETIKAAAVFCRFCNHDLPAAPDDPFNAAPDSGASNSSLDSRDICDLLSSLVLKSLVVPDDTAGRYRLLETVRQYAIEQPIDRHDSDALRNRHTEYFMAL